MDEKKICEDLQGELEKLRKQLKDNPPKSELELNVLRFTYDICKWRYELFMKAIAEKDRNKLIKDIAVGAIKKMQPSLDAMVSASKRKLDRLQNVRLPSSSYLCPKCLEKGIQTIIDVSNLPEVAVCPTCKTSYVKKDEAP